MKLSEELKACMAKSVLCWMATASKDNLPNVSPKEIFAAYQEDSIIVANIASPQSVKNIKQNPKVCISFLDILVQKGFQVKGKAEILTKTHTNFPEMEGILTKMTQGKFPFWTITRITVEQVKPIIAPRYLLYPETTEQEQIASARKSYGL
ncbi:MULTISPECIES: pyridoxamine 5'-phosphate oxidase family protein [Maribacter]|uniref:Pyridoxamine 5'-phosphate oxidase family protein n=1 Tax=Maribacter flavus TaxID=1658664 RepID=A0ABU7IDP2_9FLAO|nr:MULTISPECIES: pyridoxamine 5'-phosphate oxidase family protein [Maribacter]MDC6403923.1 pyridoxamine 5'-phosphate oxidase family protein [Maribacter sp. PR66]MEE1971064.1 pyridoxamine 5'-phosphate oxidase family protein [Maribacter flavus]